MKKTILLVFFIGLIIRILLIDIDYYAGDIDVTYIPWAKEIFKAGISGFYDRNLIKVGGVYPPLAIYSFAFIYLLYQWINKIIWFLNTTISIFPSKLVFFWEKSVVLSIMMKIPSMIADILMAFGVYLIAKKILKVRSGGVIAAPALILFNPAFIYNSSYWGQIDAMPLAFMIFSFYFLFAKKTIWSAVMFTLGLLAKQTVVIFIPLYFLALFLKNKWKEIRVNLITIFLTITVLFLPFYQKGNVFLYPFITYAKIAADNASQRLTFNAYNFWWLFTDTKLINDNIPIISGFTVGLLSRILVSAGMVGILFILCKKKLSLQNIMLCGSLIAFLTFLFSTRLHERHMMIVLPFLLIAAIKDKSLLAIFIFTSLFHFLNLYNAWGSPYIPYLTDALKNVILIKLLIMVQIGLFLLLLVRFISYKSKANYNV